VLLALGTIRFRFLQKSWKKNFMLVHLQKRRERGVCTLELCSLATVTSCIDASVRIVTKSPKVGPLLIFSISLDSSLRTGGIIPFFPSKFGIFVLISWNILPIPLHRRNISSRKMKIPAPYLPEIHTSTQRTQPLSLIPSRNILHVQVEVEGGGGGGGPY
jgi:hypothetical protein